MDLKMFSLLIAATVILFCTAEAIHISANCCTEVSKDATKTLLRRVKEYQIQKQDGICDIKAVVLHHKSKMYCVDPEGKNIRKWLKKQNGKYQEEEK
ncbi:C-C motif chemokine 28-like [Protopterus annectens]|uniref:C-C motif chemokine 28-like n=1 Tax=Protopterus annectens TaxID=7888 RepID=UPI001CFBAC02|nr:C-C motif chemokine 28-like [Protopterus annectens]